MYLLAYEAAIRKELKLPAIPSLWGRPHRCLWVDTAGADISANMVMQSPDQACKDVERIGDHAIELIDELFVHGKTAAAHDLALYLASNHLVAMTSVKGIPATELSTITFFRLKAGLFAMEGGHYERARSSLLEIEPLLRRGTDDTSVLLRVNTHLLWGRLLQLLSLPARSEMYLDKAEALIQKSGRDLPQGWGLLRFRSVVHRGGGSRSRELLASFPQGAKNYAENLYGGLGESYRQYLLARVALRKREWTSADTLFEQSKESLRTRGHNSLSDPIRIGYTLIGRGRAQTKIGFESSRPPLVEAGLRFLLKARWLFRSYGFAPGEYVAYRQFMLAHEHLARESGQRPYIQSSKELLRIGKATGVAFWHLEAGLRRARELLREGRPNAANASLNELKHSIDSDALVSEIRKLPEYRQAEQLVEETAAAPDNSVDPLATWGLSNYALREREFVESVAKPDVTAILSVAPLDGGRRLLIKRIAEARGQRVPLFEIGLSRNGDDPLEEMTEQLQQGNAVLLVNFDRWHKDHQQAFFKLLSRTKEWNRLIYVTLTRSLLDFTMIDELSPNLHSILSEKSWDVVPLEERPEDTLLLARGVLVRGLLKRGVSNPKNVIFTGRACAFIRQRYRRIGELARGMETLAYRIDVRRELIETSDDRLRVPVEVLERYLPSSAAPPRSLPKQKKKDLPVPDGTGQEATG
jgi:hypothetical protein